MQPRVKAALLASIFALCVLGAIFSPRQKPPEREQRNEVVPVNNNQRPRGIWLRV